MKGGYESCRKLMQKIKDHKSKVNCATCQHKKECNADEAKFDKFDRQMKSNRGVYING